MDQRIYADLEGDPKYLADLAWDWLLSLKQYQFGNRVMVQHTRLQPAERKIVINKDGKYCSLVEVILQRLIKSNGLWLAQLFSGNQPGAVIELLDESRRLDSLGLTPNLEHLHVLADSIVNVWTIEDILQNQPTLASPGSPAPKTTK